jgi:hypothetical protein
MRGPSADDHPRLACTELLADEIKESALGFLPSSRGSGKRSSCGSAAPRLLATPRFPARALAWYQRHGVTVEGVMTDTGSASRSHAFRDTLAAKAITHERAIPSTPLTTTARPSAPARPRSENGLTPPLSKARRSAPKLCPPGSAPTTAQGPTRPSKKATHQSVDQGQSPCRQHLSGKLAAGSEESAIARGHFFECVLRISIEIIQSAYFPRGGSRCAGPRVRFRRRR